MVDALISPLLPGILLVLTLLFVRRPRWLRVVCATGVVLCLLLVTPLGANALILLVESRAQAAECTGVRPAIVVLAGGADADASPGDFAALNLASVRRTLGGVRAWQQHPEAQLVLSGGAYGKRSPESPLMAALARAVGVPDTALVVESRARTTWESAQQLRAMRPELPQRIMLVTSALHMPRALYAFRVAGFSPCAIPVDYRYESWGGFAYLLPSGSAAAKSEAALHELGGALAYRLRAWFA